MSEVLGSDDIEDVLSSVRRLVSPEARPRPVSRDLGMDKLVLTPAQQVVPDAPRAEPLILTERSIEVEDAVAQKPVVEPAPDLGTAEPGPFDDLFITDPVAHDARPADATVADESPDIGLHVVDGEWEDAFWSEPEPALAEIALGAEEAELVTAEPVTEELAPVAQDEDLWQQGAATATKAPTIEGLSTLTDAEGNPVTVLDESALNDIVRALIREELQGVLGERITQNVRKLVRAEINRALTARSLD